MNNQKESQRLAKQLASVRKRKIKKLRKRISAGAYSVQNAAVARSLFVSR